MVAQVEVLAVAVRREQMEALAILRLQAQLKEIMVAQEEKLKELSPAIKENVAAVEAAALLLVFPGLRLAMEEMAPHLQFLGLVQLMLVAVVVVAVMMSHMGLEGLAVVVMAG
jgi:hypothetical protein